MKKIDSRAVMVTALGIAAILGCSTQMTVVDPPDNNPPGPPVPSNAPQFNGATNQAPTAPPPISGGSLITMVKPDGSALAIVADQEEDAIDVFSLGTTPALLGTLALQTGDQPGRMVADAAGRVHVVLRNGGAIADIQPTANGASLLGRRPVCSAPRGIDYDPSTDGVIVACTTGEIMSLPASGGAATASADLGRDLRDVVVTTKNIFVTRFRTAQVVTLDHAFNIINQTIPPSSTDVASEPDTAWRAVKVDDTTIQMVFQNASTNPIDVATPPGVSSYGGPPIPSQGINGSAGGVVTVATAAFSANPTAGFQQVASLASNPVVDIATTPSGFEVVSLTGDIETESGVQFTIPPEANNLTNPDAYVAISDARTAANPVVVVQRRGAHPALVVIPVVNGSLQAQSLSTVAIPQQVSHVDTGFDIFTFPTSGGIACMNCHPEGGDDSHTWTFQLATETRFRRTQNLRGGLVQNSAPYHWDGDMTNFEMLCNEVFTHRMGGGTMSSEQTAILGRFVNGMPRIPVKANLDPVKVAAGQTVFNNSGCQSCHVGGTGTLIQNQDIGKIDPNSTVTEASLQVPMLMGVADRAPYMHDGCAATLEDRLQVNDCAGNHHGNVSTMSDADKANLIEFLQTL